MALHIHPQGRITTGGGRYSDDHYSDISKWVINGVTSITQLRNCVMKITITWVTWLFEVCTDSVPRPSKCTEIVGGWGFAPDPTGGAYSAPPDPLAGLRGLLLRDLLLRGGEGILLRNSFRGLVTPLSLVSDVGSSFVRPCVVCHPSLVCPRSVSRG